MNERRYAGKNKMSHTTEWQVGKEAIYQKVWTEVWTKEDTTEHIMICQ